jgi:phosphatidyl-myo-inositol alpha-mannosyltransferase
MRILMYHCVLPEPGRKPGGVEVFVHRLAQALTLRGHDVEVLTFAASPHDAAYRVRRLRPHAAGTSQMLRQYFAPWLFNYQSFANCDIAHFHGDDWFFFRRNVPTLRTFYGSALLEARSATSIRRRIDKRLVFVLELLAARLATTTYGIGLDSQLIYNTHGLLPLGGHFPEQQVDRERQEKAPEPTIMFIGTWQGRKRGAFLHRVFQQEIRPVIPNARLSMVSDFCQPAEGVCWMKAPSDAELRAELDRSWVFCLPSTYEGFGVPYLEAMAHGLPVVATPNLGAQRLLGEGRWGILAEDRDIGRRLIDLLQNATERDSLSRAGLARAQEYAWDRVVERHEQAYVETIERWRALR